MLTADVCLDINYSGQVCGMPLVVTFSLMAALGSCLHACSQQSRCAVTVHTKDRFAGSPSC